MKTAKSRQHRKPPVLPDNPQGEVAVRERRDQLIRKWMEEIKPMLDEISRAGSPTEDDLAVRINAHC